MNTMPSAQPAAQTAVQQISQWWERQWHQEQQSDQSEYWRQQQQRQQQQQQKHYQNPQLQAYQARQQWQQPYSVNQIKEPAQARTAALQQPLRVNLRPKRRKSNPRIVPAPPSAASAAASPEAASVFTSLLASGNKYRKKTTADKPLIQAHQLHTSQSLQERQQPGAPPQLRQRPTASSGHLETSVDSQTPAAAAAAAAVQQLAERSAAAERDMAAVALDIVESQLPRGTNRSTLDCAAQQALSNCKPQASQSTWYMVLMVLKPEPCMLCKEAADGLTV